MTASANLCRLVGEHALSIVDVGAAGGLAKRWRPIGPALRVIGFEPDARSRNYVDDDYGSLVTIIDRAASNHEVTAPIYLTRKPRCSSLLKPNASLNQRFPDADRLDVVREATVACTTIDAALARLNVAEMDFLKIDTQGTELQVLQGAERSLASALGIEVEVEFQPIYEGAALFRDIDRHISERGFELFDLRRTFFAHAAGGEIAQAKGQLMFGDALYFTDWRKRALDRRQLVKLAVLMLTYGYADAVLDMLQSAPLLSETDRTSLHEACRSLEPIAGTDAQRKDTFVGSGLRLS